MSLGDAYFKDKQKNSPQTCLKHPLSPSPTNPTKSLNLHNLLQLKLQLRTRFPYFRLKTHGEFQPGIKDKARLGPGLAQIRIEVRLSYGLRLG